MRVGHLSRSWGCTHIVLRSCEGIAARALQRLPSLLERGRLTEPASHSALLAEMRRINNSVLAWIESNGKFVMTKNSEDRAVGMLLYDKYTFYVKNVNRGFAVPYERFVQMLYDMGLRREQMRGGERVAGM